MKKNEATIAARLWNEREKNFNGVTATTATASRLTSTSKIWEVKIEPREENDGSAFFNPERLTDIARAFHASSYVAVRDGKAIGVIY